MGILVFHLEFNDLPLQARVQLWLQNVLEDTCLQRVRYQASHDLFLVYSAISQVCTIRHHKSVIPVHYSNHLFQMLYELFVLVESFRD